MPVAPRILAEVGRKMQGMETDLEELASLLKLDAGITAVVLRVANTAAYNPHEAFVTLEDALARLGFARAYRLVGIAAVREISNQGLPFYGITGAQFRQNALFTALVAELISQAAGACPQGAYTVGLLRSIGKLAMDRITRKASLQWEGAVDDATEKELFGMDSSEASSLLLESWGFPTEIVRGMRAVSDPEPAERLADVLQLAAGLAERAGYGLSGEFFEWALVPEKLEFLGLTVPAVEEAVRKANKQFLAVRGAVL
jgi:HD-like signal output (HDOD) protein